MSNEIHHPLAQGGFQPSTAETLGHYILFTCCAHDAHMSPNPPQNVEERPKEELKQTFKQLKHHHRTSSNRNAVPVSLLKVPSLHTD